MICVSLKLRIHTSTLLFKRNEKPPLINCMAFSSETSGAGVIRAWNRRLSLPHSAVILTLREAQRKDLQLLLRHCALPKLPVVHDSTEIREMDQEIPCTERLIMRALALWIARVSMRDKY